MLHSTLYHANTERHLTSGGWQALIAEGNFAGIIFDCDGTLVNSGDAHFRAFQTAAMVQGRVMERSWYNTRTGLDRRSTLEAFASEGAGAFDVSCAIRDSIAAFSDLIRSALSQTLKDPSPKPHWGQLVCCH